MANSQTNEILYQDLNTWELADTHTEESHSGPHIPLIQGEQVYGPISNTTVTLLLFLWITIVVSLLARRALAYNKKSKLKLFFLTFIKFFDDQVTDAFGDKKQGRKFFPLVVGMFFIIFFGNMLGLLIDWFGLSVWPELLYILRPMHSDLNTTLVLAIITVFIMLKVQVKSQGAISTVRSYVFNTQGWNIMEKGISVFMWWLHLIGIPVTAASLALRLFGNIFAWVILISVISFLTAFATGGLFEVGRLWVIPFWFFEVFVALIQAIVFTFLMIAYFKQSSEAH